MKIPLKYNFRSLWVRRVSSFMTAAGIALTVAIVVVMLSMIHGLDSTFTETGSDLNLLVLRAGSGSEVNSYFQRERLETLRFLPGVSRDAQGEPVAAGELVVVVNYDRLTGEDSNVMLRGTSEKSFQLRPYLQLIQGRPYRGGVREVIVSHSLSRRFQDMQLGGTLEINGNHWKVVGIFEAGGSAYESEIWADYEDVARVWDRPIYSSVLLRAEGQDQAQTLVDRIRDDQRIQMDAIPERAYFARQTTMSAALKGLTFFIAVIIGIGSCFAVMNMMYGAVMARTQEVATLRALGFRRRSILTSFLVESAILALIGGLLGCLLASSFHGYSAGTSNFASLSEVVFDFRITPAIYGWGLAFSLMVGLLGGVLPARRAASLKLIEILRK